MLFQSLNYPGCELCIGLILIGLQLHEMSTTLASSPAASRSASPSRTNPISSPSSYKLVEKEKNKSRIFLGGSCNPTTWRQNVAIPFLEANGISYYNPQVDNWTPEVVNLERYAKQNAQILLFVIDKQTRSTTSLVESAFMAGENKSLVLVIYPFEYNLVSLLDESKQTSSNRFETRSKLSKTSLAKSSKDNRQQDDSSSFIESSSSSSARSSTVTSNSLSSLSSSINCESNSTTKAKRATKLTSARVNRTVKQVSSSSCGVDETSSESIHDEVDYLNGNIKMSGEFISIDEFLELKQARTILQNLLSIKKIPIFSDIYQALKYITSYLNNSLDCQGTTLGCLDKPTQLLDGSKSENLDEHSPSSTTTFKQFDHQNSQLYNFKSEPSLVKDVYLSLDCDDKTSIESTVIPILKEKGLTFNYTSFDDVTEPYRTLASSIPTTSSDHGDSINMPKLSIDFREKFSPSELTRYSAGYDDTKLAIEKEICAIKSSRVLLFVITNKCRGLSIMVLASHFMALFKDNVVLCVQYLEEPCSIKGETLTKTAIADYNRGRVYLCDYATKSQIPVFGTIQEAIECCNQKCQ